MDEKTTNLMMEAVRMLGELPEDYQVIIVGPHYRWITRLEQDFKSAGLVDVRFFTVSQVCDGRHRGLRGYMLIDDLEDISYKARNIVIQEREAMNVKAKGMP